MAFHRILTWVTRLVPLGPLTWVPNLFFWLRYSFFYVLAGLVGMHQYRVPNQRKRHKDGRQPYCFIQRNTDIHAKRKFKLRWSSIPPIATKWTIISHLNSLNTNSETWVYAQTVEIKSDCYSASSLKQHSVDRHVSPLGHIILIPSQQSFAPFP
jgi:hypothetical protein